MTEPRRYDEALNQYNESLNLYNVTLDRVNEPLYLYNEALNQYNEPLHRENGRCMGAWAWRFCFTTASRGRVGDMAAYGDDLAYIHDSGFGDFARGAAPGVLQTLRRNGVKDGLVVDLGCGSGIWAEILLAEGYDVLGVDLSPGMLALARRRAPEAIFLEGSLHEVKLPRCAAVTALGECINYLFDPEEPDVPAAIAGAAVLRSLFARVHAALQPGGLFIFDVAEPGQILPDRPRHGLTSGPCWAITVDVREDAKARILTRRMSFLRFEADDLRRGEEVHRQRLYPKKEVKTALVEAGFEVRTARAYGSVPLALAHTAFIARKPAVRRGGIGDGRRPRKPR